MENSSQPTDALFDGAATDGNLSEDDKQTLQQVRSGKDDIKLPPALTGDDGAASGEGNILKILADLTIPGKIKLAMLGNKTARAFLIKDSNKQIPMFVLRNPRLSEDEVLEFARNSNLDDKVLRAIAGNSSWMKNYIVKATLVQNPKTPIDVSIKWVKFLNDKDLKTLAKSKNVPSVVSTRCRKLIEQRVKKKKG